MRRILVPEVPATKSRPCPSFHRHSRTLREIGSNPTGTAPSARRRLRALERCQRWWGGCIPRWESTRTCEGCHGVVRSKPRRAPWRAPEVTPRPGSHRRARRGRTICQGQIGRYGGYIAGSPRVGEGPRKQGAGRPLGRSRSHEPRDSPTDHRPRTGTTGEGTDDTGASDEPMARWGGGRREPE